MVDVRQEHVDEYEHEAEVAVRSPCRFHLLGDHSFFFRDKAVSMAVDFDVKLALNKRTDGDFYFYFSSIKMRKKVNLAADEHEKKDKWVSFIKSVILSFISSDYKIGGLNLTLESELPLHSGFGVTSAVRVAVAVALNQLFKFELSVKELILIVEKACDYPETSIFMVNSFVSFYAEKDKLMISDLRKKEFTNVPLAFSEEIVFLLINAAVPRFIGWDESTLFQSEYALVLGDLRELKSEVFGGWRYIKDVTEINETLGVLGEEVRSRLLFIMDEHKNVLDMEKALRKADYNAFCHAINTSFDSLREKYNYSCPEVDWMIRRLQEVEPNLERLSSPVSAGRITGSGKSVTMYAVLRKSDVDSFVSRFSDYNRIFGTKIFYKQIKSAPAVSLL